MTRAEFMQKHNTMYQWLLKNNKLLLDKHLPATRKKWTLELCKKEAKKYKTRTKFYKSNRSAYSAALRNNWIETCCKHMETIKHSGWTLQLCKKEAKKYKTRGEFKKANINAYSAAVRKNWLQDCCRHMEAAIHPGWTLELCKKESKKYKTRNEFIRANQSAYRAVRVNGWLEVCCKHMKPSATAKKKIICVENNKVYESISAAAKELELSTGLLSQVVSGKLKQAKGYTFKYYEEN